MRKVDIEDFKLAVGYTERAIKIVKALAKTKSRDTLGGYYRVFEVKESLVNQAKQLIKDSKGTK